MRYIDGDERQPSRLAILVGSKADGVAAELEELTKFEVWVAELACAAEKGAPIQQVKELIHHEPHAPPPRRLRYAFWVGEWRLVGQGLHHTSFTCTIHHSQRIFSLILLFFSVRLPTWNLR